jgi:predicted ATPase
MEHQGGAPQVVACGTVPVARSLIAADVGRAIQSYGLLETTRAYAFEKLAASGELDAVKRSHAEYLRDLADLGWSAPLTAERPPAYGGRTGHTRAAQDGSFSSGGSA